MSLPVKLMCSKASALGGTCLAAGRSSVPKQRARASASVEVSGSTCVIVPSKRTSLLSTSITREPTIGPSAGPGESARSTEGDIGRGAGVKSVCHTSVGL